MLSGVLHLIDTLSIVKLTPCLIDFMLLGGSQLCTGGSAPFHPRQGNEGGCAPLSPPPVKVERFDRLIDPLTESKLISPIIQSHLTETMFSQTDQSVLFERFELIFTSLIDGSISPLLIIKRYLHSYSSDSKLISPTGQSNSRMNDWSDQSPSFTPLTNHPSFTPPTNHPSFTPLTE